METLISDCFPPIFSYLSLADFLHLRTVSRRLKLEVEDYLPTVRSLPLYLTTPRTPEEIAEYERLCLSVEGAYPDIDSPDSLSKEGKPLWMNVEQSLIQEKAMKEDLMKTMRGKVLIIE